MFYLAVFLIPLTHAIAITVGFFWWQDELMDDSWLCRVADMLGKVGLGLLFILGGSGLMTLIAGKCYYLPILYFVAGFKTFGVLPLFLLVCCFFAGRRLGIYKPPYSTKQ